jgi:methylated-DNA-[protein]-cysteine S-methyltransferase
MKNIQPESMPFKKSDWAAVIKVPFGKLGLKTGFFDGSLMIQEIAYLAEKTDLQKPKNALANLACEQFEEYFRNPRFEIHLPLMPHGTLHQNKVWRKISEIPLGQAITYGEIAQAIKSAPRAVGQACGANPFPIVVPCHRVISATGIGGFARKDEAGYHRNIKTWLLQHEGLFNTR